MSSCWGVVSARRQALISAASTTAAVPCWSSWNAATPTASCTRLSTSKHFGEAISSSWMTPNDGEMAAAAWTMSLASWLRSAIGKAFTPTRCARSAALPSRIGIAASGPRFPSPRTAEPSLIIATVLAMIV